MTNQHTVAPAELPAITSGLRDLCWKHAHAEVKLSAALAEQFQGKDVFLEGSVYRINRIEFFPKTVTLRFYFSDGRSGAKQRTVYLNDLMVDE